MTPLRKRMIEDMRLRHFAPKTREAYLSAVSALAKYYGRSPDLLTKEEVRKYFVYLVEERKLSPSTIRVHLCGIRFLFEVTLGREWKVFDLVQPKRGRKLPVVLSRDEVRRLIETVRNLKYRIMMLCAYLCGLRLGEIISLRLCHIDGERMQIRVVSGKRNKDRNVPLPKRLLELMREYWLEEKPSDWLFPTTAHWRAGEPIHCSSLGRVINAAAEEAGIEKHVTAHTLRHCYATHLLECGVDLRIIQEMLGHKSPETTAIYTHLTDKTLDRLSRALDEMSEGF